ncbi:MAG: class I SAM-dependent methyltransferase [Gemmatimonadaceae bacterium]|nr:class I SAM-dependent methyltransferase [Gemmatimonadaceae bacterium]
MRRYTLFEIEDQPWCPGVVRDGVTDYLAHAISVGRAYAPAAPLLARVLETTSEQHIVDLAAGGGGPWQSLLPDLEALGARPTVRLTDYTPNRNAFAAIERSTAGQVSGERHAVDARAIPSDLAGIRTIFSALHHFAPHDARAILADAVASGRGFAAFEATHRSDKALLLTALAPIIALFLTPAIRPVRISRLVFTYLIPIIPLVILWDGLVSCLRTYTPNELVAMAHEATPPDASYHWEAGEAGDGPIPVTYLIGWPSQ